MDNARLGQEFSDRGPNTLMEVPRNGYQGIKTDTIALTKQSTNFWCGRGLACSHKGGYSPPLVLSLNPRQINILDNEEKLLSDQGEFQGFHKTMRKLYLLFLQILNEVICMKYLMSREAPHHIHLDWHTWLYAHQISPMVSSSDQSFSNHSPAICIALN